MNTTGAKTAALVPLLPTSALQVLFSRRRTTDQVTHTTRITASRLPLPGTLRRLHREMLPLRPPPTHTARLPRVGCLMAPIIMLRAPNMLYIKGHAGHRGDPTGVTWIRIHLHQWPAGGSAAGVDSETIRIYAQSAAP